MRRPRGSLKAQHLRGLPALEVWLQAAPGMHTRCDRPAGGLRGGASFYEALAAPEVGVLVETMPTHSARALYFHPERVGTHSSFNCVAYLELKV